MKQITAPHFLTAHISRLCADNMENADLAMRLDLVENFLTQSENDYRVRAAANELYLIAESDTVNGLITKAEMSALYQDVFARLGGPTRDIYNAIKALAPRQICPLCNQRVVYTLDHHLAKGFHPALAITPLNLVPACRDCNLGSGTRRPASPGDQTVHPYFDNVDDEIWLVAEIVESSPPAVLYSASPPAHWHADKQSKVRSHFEAFKLSELYSAHGGAELVNIYADIANNEGLDNSLDIRAHLRETSLRRRWPFQNSWQAAVYEAAANSDWFCDGGYEEVSENFVI